MSSENSSDIIITPHIREVIRRTLRSRFDTVIRDGLTRVQSDPKDDEDKMRLWTEYVGKLQVAFHVRLPEHEDDCDQADDDDGDDGDCDCCMDREFTVSIFYCPSAAASNGRKFPLAEYNFYSNFKRENVSAVIMERLCDAYRLCHCGHDLESEDGWCSMCYIHRHERSDEEGGVCCICHENEGRWVKLGCGHVMHRHCQQKLVKACCPMCREKILVRDIVSDPFNF